MYTWLENTLRTEYEPIRLLKESPRGSVRLIRHRGSGRRFILRRFTGNGEVYQKLLACSCPNLPLVMEAAEKDGENMVIEEFIQGDTLGFLLEEALFTPRETRDICTPAGRPMPMICRKRARSNFRGSRRREISG